MPRHARLDAPGALHHVMIRGINKGNIFEDDEDKTRFLAKLADTTRYAKASIYAFALMDNHAHILISSGEKGLAAVMRKTLENLWRIYGEFRGRCCKRCVALDASPLGTVDFHMPRHARLDAPGALHHVMIRGINKGNIFEDDEDKTKFLAKLADTTRYAKASIYAFALMDNHAHILISSGEKGLAAVMRKTLTWYAVHFNRRHKRVGHLFQNRYKSILCEEDGTFRGRCCKRCVAVLLLPVAECGEVGRDVVSQNILLLVSIMWETTSRQPH